MHSAGQQGIHYAGAGARASGVGSRFLNGGISAMSPRASIVDALLPRTVHQEGASFLRV